MSVLKHKFDLMIKDSLTFQGNIYPDGVYYNREYFKRLLSVLIDRNLFSSYNREFHYYGDGRYKICSVASSSRLCFMYFQSNQNISFEKELKTGLKGFSPTLDAYDRSKQIYYECKCHEIFDNKTITESKKFKSSYHALFKQYLNITVKSNEKDRLDIMLKDLEINDKRSIYELRFDVKQFLCHLFGMANNGGGTLQYLFFTPKKDLICSDKDIVSIYEELNSEMKMIWNSPKIKYLCEDKMICLENPVYVSVEAIDDIIARAL